MVLGDQTICVRPFHSGTPTNKTSFGVIPVEMWHVKYETNFLNIKQETLVKHSLMTASAIIVIFSHYALILLRVWR
jgi:hypothetical protein